MIFTDKYVMNELKKNSEIHKGTPTCTVRLHQFDSAWNPASTDRMIYGPINVTYKQFPDGGIEARLSSN